MSKINNVGLNLGHKIANPFKTSRNITTPNPFKDSSFSSFEGNSLPIFADVFDGFELKKTNKLKMIASTVTGSMTKLRTSITEPIVNFVNRVVGGVSSAWDYAKNTDVLDLAPVKAFNNLMNTEIKIPGLDTIHNSISGIGKGITTHMESIHTNIGEIGKNISEKWNTFISSVEHHSSTKDKSVDELKAMWMKEIELSSERKVA